MNSLEDVLVDLASRIADKGLETQEEIVDEVKDFLGKKDVVTKGEPIVINTNGKDEVVKIIIKG